jgi:hypothetical protein
MPEAQRSGCGLKAKPHAGHVIASEAKQSRLRALDCFVGFASSQ